ncbi:MAG: SoxR reducing system RseC family protein [Candidatus Omnitrophica bacterium]|nr:SoxR reducing system RseC family protein [Candidatus Omnitrophota bacterium]MBU1128297.1 SoxR reducing system RseC family protein [Candidatus Omnitrophota bacterium]MBU1851085.1 SoxR reducing system RseC family protein [Candidatus Omnitrophota bacterium]
MQENGVVKGIKDGVATVEIIPWDECKTCGSCGAAQPRSIKVSADDFGDIRCGDPVTVNVAPPAMLKVYLLLYAVPLVVFVGLILTGYAVSGHPLWSFVGAILATICVYVLIGRYMRNKPEFLPQICPR